MKNGLSLMLAHLTIAMVFMSSCFRAAPSAQDEPAAQTPDPVIDIPPAEQTTPNWIYAIIAIGAALAVAVTIYIIRSRRP